MNYKAFLVLLSIILCTTGMVYAQSFEVAKYGGDFLSVGGGARALGMGSAQVAMRGDVTSAYWNVAGLADVDDLQVIYMHSERFSGIVGYDYGAVALPVKHTGGVFAISFFRQGVDNIKNTLNAWDRDRNLPRQNPQDYITEFSTADAAIFISYSARRSDQLSWGATAKLVNSRLGPFANAWGYSLDLGALYQTPLVNVGVNLMDISTMMKFWNVNENKLKGLSQNYGDTIPTGQNELVLPTIKIGASRLFTFNDFKFTTATDVDMRFEGRRAYYLNVGDVSFEPHVGGELTYKDKISFRAGVTDFTDNFGSGFTVSPTLGAGFYIHKVQLDYGFASFAGATSDLGFTHRISLKVTI